MKLIVGLGNPGVLYRRTRHNTGYIIIDNFIKILNLNFSSGKEEYVFSKGKIDNQYFYLMKPMTFMNNSGEAVYDFINKYEIDIKDLLIIFDDFNLPLGTIRVRERGTDGGHNGMENLIYNLNTTNFARMKVGIGTNNKKLKEEDYIKYVLSKFPDEELTKLKSILPNCSECLMSFLTEDIKTTMNKFNKNFLINNI